MAPKKNQQSKKKDNNTSSPSSSSSSTSSRMPILATTPSPSVPSMPSLNAGIPTGTGDTLKLKLDVVTEMHAQEVVASSPMVRAELQDVERRSRITLQRLLSVYDALKEFEFDRDLIEEAMKYTGGTQLNSCIEYICLYAPHERLPKHFVDKLSGEKQVHPIDEKSTAPKVTAEPTKYMPPLTPADRSPPKSAMGLRLVEALHESIQKGKGVDATNRKYILDCKAKAEESLGYDSNEEDDDDDDSDDIDAELEREYGRSTRQVKSSQGKGQPQQKNSQAKDPNAEYRNLRKRLDQINLNELPSLKAARDSKKVGERVHEAKDIEARMSILSKDKCFDARILLERPASQQATQIPQLPLGPTTSEPSLPGKSGEDTEKFEGETSLEYDSEEGGLFSMFEEIPSNSVPTNSEPALQDSTVSVAPRTLPRSFDFKGWRGALPKDLLDEWCRKYISPQSKISYTAVSKGFQASKFQVSVETKSGERKTFIPDAMSEDGEQARHLAATKALYELARDTPIESRLPPCYREWWQEQASQAAISYREEKALLTKDRDEFIAGLLAARRSAKGKNTLRSKGISESALLEGDEVDDDDNEEEDDDDDISEPTSTAVVPLESVSYPSSLDISFATLSKLKMQYQALVPSADIVRAQQELPIYAFKQQIVELVASNQITIVIGETGCGKSTNVPRYILEDGILGQRPCYVLCTQPRKISATSIAQRVSEEMGDVSPGFCGFHVKMDASFANNTRLVYCTTGILLRYLQSDPLLSKVTHVVVDEVHERSVQTDFLLILLKALLLRRADLRVVLMSATLDAEKLHKYFHGAGSVTVPGRLYPVEVCYLEDVLEATNYTLDSDSPYALAKYEEEEDVVMEFTVAGLGGRDVTVSSRSETRSTSGSNAYTLHDMGEGKYSEKTLRTLNRLDLSKINYELIELLLMHITKDAKYADARQGSILVFLPGYAEIMTLYNALSSNRHFYELGRYEIIPLHSMFSSEEQNKIFQPLKARKIVLATNIAETGLTIPDVVFVVDCGRVKETSYRNSTRMRALTEQMVSRASADQRKGRAGRVRAGYAFRMFTEHTYKGLAAQTTPELLRVPIEDLCLYIHASHLGKAQDVLASALDPPEPKAVQTTLDNLVEVGALVVKEEGADPEITPLGAHLARLPMDVHLAKMAVYACMFGCLEPILIIAATLSSRSPFLVPFDKKNEAAKAKMAFASHGSDLLTIVKAYETWQSKRLKGKAISVEERIFCAKNYLNRSALINIEEMVLDLAEQLGDAGLIPQPRREGGGLIIPSELNKNAKNISLLKAIVVAGLMPKVALYNPPERGASSVPPLTLAKGTGFIHPSSIIHSAMLPSRNLQASCIMFHSKVETSRVYLHECTYVSVLPVLFFAANPVEIKFKERKVVLDKWLSISLAPKPAVLLAKVRNMLQQALFARIEKPSLNLWEDPVVSVFLELLEKDAS